MWHFSFLGGVSINIIRNHACTIFDWSGLLVHLIASHQLSEVGPLLGVCILVSCFHQTMSEQIPGMTIIQAPVYGAFWILENNRWFPLLHVFTSSVARFLPAIFATTATPATTKWSLPPTRFSLLTAFCHQAPQIINLSGYVLVLDR